MNENKTVCLRVGREWRANCFEIKVGNKKIDWVADACYLGICVKSGPKFTTSFENIKSKFYRSTNAILGKLGSKQNPFLKLKLISTIALPSLMYALDALRFNTSQLSSLELPWSRVFMKFFATLII